MNHPALQPRRRWRRALGAGVLALLVAACGGETAQYDPFLPKQMFVFGDEASALGDGTTAPAGAKWSVNGLGTDGSLDCAALPIWTQSVASIYGLVFAECNPRAVAEPTAKIWAVAGAKVRDIPGQIQRQIDAGGFGSRQLATFFVGVNDIVELYGQYPQRSADELAAEADARGRQAGDLVNQLIKLDARVLLVNLPDLSYSPWALKERALYTDTDRAALIARLVEAFNLRLGVTIIPDGRYIGMVTIYGTSNAIGRSPSSYGYANASQALCTAALPNCTTATLAEGGSTDNWLWADDLWFTSRGQNEIANLAIARATRNPF
jgi:outer membrane lipase/esterase